MLHGLVDLNFSGFFMLPDCIHIRGHNYKLFKPQCSQDVRKYFFAKRVVDSWNSFPSYIVSAPLQTFKKLLNSYEFVFDNMVYH